MTFFETQCNWSFKIGARVDQIICDTRQDLKFKRSKVKVTQLRTGVIVSNSMEIRRGQHKICTGRTSGVSLDGEASATREIFVCGSETTAARKSN